MKNCPTALDCQILNKPWRIAKDVKFCTIWSHGWHLNFITRSENIEENRSGFVTHHFHSNLLRGCWDKFCANLLKTGCFYDVWFFLPMSALQSQETDPRIQKIFWINRFFNSIMQLLSNYNFQRSYFKRFVHAILRLSGIRFSCLLLLEQHVLLWIEKLNKLWLQ